MAKDDNDKAEEPIVDETIEIPEEPKVELDKPTDIEGELVENPVLEEESENVEPAAVEEPKEDEPSPELEPEKDDSGVYSPSTISDPGTFQPTGDYGFEVPIADGRTVKINSPAEAEAFAQRLDSEEGLLTAAQFLHFSRQVARMDSGIEREQAQYESQKEEFESQQAQEQTRNEQVTQWSNELNYLQTKGLLPEIPKTVDVPGGWENNPDEPGVKSRMEIFQYMQKENNDRRSAGIPEITSVVDAYKFMQADTQEQAAKTERSREVTDRRSKGKMVSGNSSFTPSNERAGSIVGEGGNLRDLVTEFNAS